MDKCGIYKITNIINGKIYIGQSSRIKARWAEHRRKAFNEEVYPNEYNKVLYKAFREYGIENFKFEILEECEKILLLEKESYYIDKYDSYNKGYNETKGGDVGGINNKGSNHPNSKLTESDVKDIRYRYSLCKEYIEDIYEDYKNIIKYSGFKKVFFGYTWKHVMMDVYTTENKSYHFSHGQSRPGSKNGRSKISEMEANSIKNRLNNGERICDIYNDYKDKCSIDVIKNISRNKTWK